MEELKACPFCGGRAILGMFTIWCENCAVETQQNTDKTKKEIIKAWNTRPQPETVCKSCSHIGSVKIEPPAENMGLTKEDGITPVKIISAEVK